MVLPKITSDFLKRVDFLALSLKNVRCAGFFRGIAPLQPPTQINVIVYCSFILSMIKRILIEVAQIRYLI